MNYQYFPLPMYEDTVTITTDVETFATLGIPESVLKIADKCLIIWQSGDPLTNTIAGADPNDGGILVDDEALMGIELVSHSQIRKWRGVSGGSTDVFLSFGRSN